MALPKQKWDDRFYVRIYELRRSGINSKQSVAQVLGLHPQTIHRWFNENEALQDAWERGAANKEDKEDFSFKDYVFDRLPLPLQTVWNGIMGVNDADEPDAQIKIQALTGGLSKKSRQRLLLFALTQSQYSLSIALRYVNVTARQYRKWCAEDPDFEELANEMEWHKDNFFEDQYLRLVRRGEPAAVLHAAKTRLRARGYGDVKQVDMNVSGTIQQNVTVLNADIMDQLSLSARRELLAVVRADAAHRGAPVLPGTVLNTKLIEEAVTVADEDD